MAEEKEMSEADLDKFISSLENTKSSAENEKKAFSFEQWEKEIQRHPAFTSSLEPGDNREMSEAMEALAAMQYDEDDPIELALKHKMDGNKQFEKKLYKWAVHCYTEGLKVKCPDANLNGVLLANRAAAQIRLGNIRSAFGDCVFSLKFKPEENEKILVRGVECLLKLNRPEEAEKWLGEISEKSEKVENLRATAEKMRKIKERDRRKMATAERKDEDEKKRLLECLNKRKVKFGSKIHLPFDDPKALEWTELEISFPGVENCRVKLDKSGNHLLWPVLFCYPEFGQTDIVKEFPENSTFYEQLAEILKEIPDWDRKGEYEVDKVGVFFESCNCLVDLDMSSCLKDCFENGNFVLHKPMPCFLVMVKNEFCEEYKSSFSKRFLEGQ